MILEFDSKVNELASYRDGEKSLELFIYGDTKMRDEIILNYPDVIGYIYLNDDVITKEFLPKKLFLSMYLLGLV